jgi:hypothetical protein
MLPASVLRASGIGLLLMLLLATTATAAEEDNWPREIVAGQGARIVIYQPQLDAQVENSLRGRAAVAVTLAGETSAVFGTIWFESRIQTALAERTVEILDAEVSLVRFDDATPEQESSLASILEDEVPEWNLALSLDRVIASLALVENRAAVSEGLHDDPPEIIFETSPAILLSFDGEPHLLPTSGTTLELVVNTPFLVSYDPSTEAYFLFASEETWFTAPKALGPWSAVDSVPSRVRRMVPPETGTAPEAEPGEPFTVPTVIPKIITRTEPAELIVTDGSPELRPLAGGDLEYFSNTDSDILLEVESGDYFALISGRWFAAPDLAGPWTFVPADTLPKSFSKIEKDSEKAYLRSSVAGTEEATEAFLESQIPQTATIRRDLTVEVDYDGSPQFENIDGTELQYAVNTGSQVLRFEDQYFNADSGVWYVAPSPNGTWEVATEIPPAVYLQPPSSPLYNTTFLHVYHSTPTYVFVGHHPGYLNSFHHHGCMVWGTGWHHSPWFGTMWFPRPPTWGMHMRWSSHSGWSVGMSWSSGPFTFGMSTSSWGHSSRAGWWGPAGFHSYAAGFNRGLQQGRRQGFQAGVRAGTGVGDRRSSLYDRPENRERNATGLRAGTSPRTPVVAADRPNNLFSDSGGNVHRRRENGSWQQRQGGDWSPSSASVLASPQGRSTGRDLSGRSPSRSTNRTLGAEYRARQQGTARSQRMSSPSARSFSGNAGRRGTRR